MRRSAIPKGLSLGSPAVLRIDGHPHDYRLHGNREFVVASGTSVVKLWISWYDLQASHRPESLEESWNQLSESPGDLPLCSPFSNEPALQTLDRQIAAANADGVEVVLALDECSPPWAVGPHAPMPAGLSRYVGRASGARPPLDRSPEGPWAWFLEHLCVRYGDPQGIHVSAIEILNEPNLRWPQESAHLAVADMMRTAAQIASRSGGPAILAPSLSDLPGKWLHGDWGPGTPLGMFARQLLRELHGWTPEATVGWSQHNYGDLGRAQTTGIEHALALLEHYGWHDTEHGIWLTEGGVTSADPLVCEFEEAFRWEHIQSERMALNFEYLCDYDQIRLWTYHSLHDLANQRDKIGLRQDFDWEREAAGAEKLAWDRFVELPGSGDAFAAGGDADADVALPAA
jgi:hypothetical protein